MSFVAVVLFMRLPVGLVRPFTPFSPFPFDIHSSAAPFVVPYRTHCPYPYGGTRHSPLLSPLCCPFTVHRCACCLGVERGTLHSSPLNIHIVADTPEGLHLGNRWSVSAANATTRCYSLSHHTPKGGYTREEQRVYLYCPLNITPSIILSERLLELLLNHQTQLLRLNHLNATAIIHQFTHQVIGQLHAIREDRVVIVHLLHLTVV